MSFGGQFVLSVGGSPSLSIGGSPSLSIGTAFVCPSAGRRPKGAVPVLGTKKPCPRQSGFSVLGSLGSPSSAEQTVRPRHKNPIASKFGQSYSSRFRPWLIRPGGILRESPSARF